jgi:hypothetical protein
LFGLFFASHGKAMLLILPRISRGRALSHKAKPLLRALPNDMVGLPSKMQQCTMALDHFLAINLFSLKKFTHRDDDLHGRALAHQPDDMVGLGLEVVRRYVLLHRDHLLLPLARLLRALLLALRALLANVLSTRNDSLWVDRISCLIAADDS